MPENGQTTRILRYRPASLVVAACLAMSLHVSANTPEPRSLELGTVYALLINGGQSAKNNALSHLHHLQDMVETLKRRGIPPERISIFSTDGDDPEVDLLVRRDEDPGAWLLEGTRVERRLRVPELTNTTWEGVKLNAATLAELRPWFEQKGRELVPGDTLLIFVTDHGTKNSDDPSNGFIMLWKQRLSVLEYRALLAHLKPGVRVVNVMSQCFSGVFADAMAPLNNSTPTGDVCGFYSTTEQRPAYGCYPEGRDRDRIGHAFRFIEAMDWNETMDDAHVEVLLSDATPDVPLRTSDLYLERLLREEATRREMLLEPLSDELLREAWRDRGRWEPQIRMLDRMAAHYGTFSPRTLEEFQAQIDDLQALSNQLDTYIDLWRAVLNDLREENLLDFLESDPGWAARLRAEALDKPDDEGKKRTRDDLLPELAAFTREQEDNERRLWELKLKLDESQNAGFRTEIRLAALLRMRTLLMRVAGEHFLERSTSVGQTDLEAARDALAGLKDCEATTIGALHVDDIDLRDFAALPSFEEDLAVVDRVLPSWFGISFRPLPDSQRSQLELERGAVQVQQVYDGTGAQAAGIRPGDILIGPPGQPFDEPRRVREFIMQTPQNTPVSIELLRDGEPVKVAITLGPYPMQMPSIPAPPGQGDQAPELTTLSRVAENDEKNESMDTDGRHLLFFWATWCAPCKRSVPELMAWSETTKVPIVAISDEDAETVRTFLEKSSEPFPEVVTVDELRQSHVTYGINGTPTFVLVDDSGTIEWRQTGYSPQRGLSVRGWDWEEQPVP